MEYCGTMRKNVPTQARGSISHHSTTAAANNLSVAAADVLLEEIESQKRTGLLEHHVITHKTKTVPRRELNGLKWLRADASRPWGISTAFLRVYWRATREDQICIHNGSSYQCLQDPRKKMEGGILHKGYVGLYIYLYIYSLIGK